MTHLTAFSTFFDDLDDDLDSCTVNVCGLVEHCSGVGGGGDCGSGVWPWNIRQWTRLVFRTFSTVLSNFVVEVPFPFC